MVIAAMQATEADIREGNLAALSHLIDLVQWSSVAALVLSGFMLYRSISRFGAPSFGKTMWIWFSGGISFFAVIAPFAIIFNFGDTLSQSIPGVSILTGLGGIASIGFLRLQKMWATREEQMQE
jgi:hypothetical protein